MDNYESFLNGKSLMVFSCQVSKVSSLAEDGENYRRRRQFTFAVAVSILLAGAFDVHEDENAPFPFEN